MLSSLSPDLRAFLRFSVLAKKEIISWYGSHCDNDVGKLAFMATKEWDGMTHIERRPFDKNNESCPEIEQIIDCHSFKTSPSDSFTSVNSKDSLKLKIDIFSKAQPDHIKRDPLVEDLLSKRNELHQLYAPRELNILEYMIKTKPRWPRSSRIWFLRAENRIQSTNGTKSWDHLTNEEKDMYERCAVLDQKRYVLEKNAWVTKIITLDLSSDDFTLSDFDIPEVKRQIDSMGSIPDLSRYLPANIGLKRPREPFSIFIEAYQYQIREERPKFQFGRHLRDCSEAWKKLSEEEKQFYKNESEKLKEKRRKLLQNDARASESRLSVPVDLFRPNRAVFGPCRPSHLYPKLPSIIGFWSARENITTKPLKDAWDNLEPDKKSAIRVEYEKLKKSVEEEKKRINLKHAQVKNMVRESTKLKELKCRLGLMNL